MKEQLFDYDDSDINSVVDYSKVLLNYRFGQIVEEYQRSPYKTYDDFQNKIVSDIEDKDISMKSKGQFGNYIEKFFFGYLPCRLSFDHPEHS